MKSIYMTEVQHMILYFELKIMYPRQRQESNHLNNCFDKEYIVH